MFSLEDTALVYCRLCEAAFEKSQLRHGGPYHVLSNGVASIPCPRCSYTVTIMGKAYRTLYWPQQVGSSSMALRETQEREMALENLARLRKNEAHLFGGLNGYHIRFFDLSDAEKIDWEHIAVAVAETPLALRYVKDINPCSDQMRSICEIAVSSAQCPTVMRFIPEDSPHYERLIGNVFCGHGGSTPHSVQYVPKITVNIARIILTWSIAKSCGTSMSGRRGGKLRLTDVSHLQETTRQLAKKWGILSPSEKHDIVEFLAYKLWEDWGGPGRDSLSFWLEAETALSC